MGQGGVDDIALELVVGELGAVPLHVPVGVVPGQMGSLGSPGGVYDLLGHGHGFQQPRGGAVALLRIIAESVNMEAAAELCGEYEEKLRALDREDPDRP